MNKLDLFRLAQGNLWRRKVRTILTTLGVVIGTTSIVVMISLGIGLKENQEQNMERWGSLTMIRVQPGMMFDNEGKPLGEGKHLNDQSLKEITELEGVLAVSPAYDIGGEVKFGRKKGGIQLIGLDPTVMSELEFEASDGRLLQSGDRNVAVVGRQVINNLRDESELKKIQKGVVYYKGGPMQQEMQDPTQMLNQRFSMLLYNNGNREKKKYFGFQVVGILEGDFNENSHQAFAPIEDIKKMRKFMTEGGKSGGSGAITREMVAKATAGGVTRTVAGKKSAPGYNPDDYSYFLVRTADVAETRRLSQVLKDRGFNAWSIADQLEGIEKTSRTIQAVLGGIGSITLLVAALGITNTMIMSIYERTKEIGIIKVIGATFRDVHAMFLAEAGLIGLIGGAIGLGVSYLASYVINNLSRGFMNRGMPVSQEEVLGISLIPPWLAVFAVVFAGLIGIVAGLYPAYRAVRLSPINAIRND